MISLIELVIFFGISLFVYKTCKKWVLGFFTWLKKEFWNEG